MKPMNSTLTQWDESCNAFDAVVDEYLLIEFLIGIK
jgi:hypothetical protein